MSIPTPVLLKFQPAAFPDQRITRRCETMQDVEAALTECHLSNWNLLSAEPEWLALEIYQEAGLEAGLWRNVFESPDLRELTERASQSTWPWRIVNAGGHVYRRGDGAAEVIEV